MSAFSLWLTLAIVLVQSCPILEKNDICRLRRLEKVNVLFYQSWVPEVCTGLEHGKCWENFGSKKQYLVHSFVVLLFIPWSFFFLLLYHRIHPLSMYSSVGFGIFTILSLLSVSHAVSSCPKDERHLGLSGPHFPLAPCYFEQQLMCFIFMDLPILDIA